MKNAFLCSNAAVRSQHTCTDMLHPYIFVNQRLWPLRSNIGSNKDWDTTVLVRSLNFQHPNWKYWHFFKRMVHGNTGATRTMVGANLNHSISTIPDNSACSSSPAKSELNNFIRCFLRETLKDTKNSDKHGDASTILTAVHYTQHCY